MMSVVLHGSLGWVLDTCSLIDRGYSPCIRWRENQKSAVKCSFKRQCFQVFKSYYNENTRADVDAGITEVLQKTCKSSKKKKRKHHELNRGEIDSQVFHEKIKSVILEGTKYLVDSAQALGYLNGQTNVDKEPLPSQECNLAALCEMAKDLPLVEDEEQEQGAQLLVGEDGCTSHVDLFSQVTENKADWATVVTLMGEEYVTPPHTAFLLSDFTRIQPLVHYGTRFDLIVMDPPWENKSVKRSRRYGSLPSSQLKQLPIPLLASPNCLVVTWVTNRPSHLRFVRDQLYPHWGVEVLAEWFWVKVTTSGQFVFPLDSPHKKPYEILVLGRYHCSADISESPSETSQVPVEHQRLIVSVPSALHSQKPSLSDHVRPFMTRDYHSPDCCFQRDIVPYHKVPYVLKPYIGAEAKCLELFARSLQPGWTSWGNEVLKFQHVSYFNLTPVDEKAEAEDDTAQQKQSPGFGSLGKTQTS